MRGELPTLPHPTFPAAQGEWSMLRFSKPIETFGVESEYVSSHMERRPDGKYVLVFDREK